MEILKEIMNNEIKSTGMNEINTSGKIPNNKRYFIGSKLVGEVLDPVCLGS